MAKYKKVFVVNGKRIKTTETSNETIEEISKRYGRELTLCVSNILACLEKDNGKAIIIPAHGIDYMILEEVTDENLQD